MPVCGFCGHDNTEGARSCISCGNVFEGEGPSAPGSEDPRTPGDAGALDRPATSPDAGLFKELVSLAGPERPSERGAGPERPLGAGSGRAPGADEAPLRSGAARLADLFDRDPVVAASRQAVVMVAVGIAVTLAAAVAVVLDTAKALDALDVGAGTLLVDNPTLAPRTDVLSLAEVSLVAGVLVMLGGWSQQVAANRALLDVPTTRHSARWALLAWLIPGPNAVLPGMLARELWDDTAPPGMLAPPPRLVRLWPALFGVALAARYVATGFGFLAPDIADRSTALVTAGVLAGALVLWITALAATIVFVRALTSRQLARADALRG